VLGLIVDSQAIFQVNVANVTLKDGRNFEGDIKSIITQHHIFIKSNFA
jgi:hypothetical protein